jgi:hypothetical protein
MKKMLNTVPPLPTPGHAAASAPQVRVWDPLLRIFHWGLAASFAVAFVAEDDFLSLHVQAGYLVLGLILFRFVWGFVGPRHARWSDFLREPAAVTAYLRDALRFRAGRHLGHRPKRPRPLWGAGTVRPPRLHAAGRAGCLGPYPRGRSRSPCQFDPAAGGVSPCRRCSGEPSAPRESRQGHGHGLQAE